MIRFISNSKSLLKFLKSLPENIKLVRLYDKEIIFDQIFKFSPGGCVEGSSTWYAVSHSKVKRLISDLQDLEEQPVSVMIDEQHITLTIAY